jgi:hypothetical protein
MRRARPPKRVQGPSTGRRLSAARGSGTAAGAGRQRRTFPPPDGVRKRRSSCIQTPRGPTTRSTGKTRPRSTSTPGPITGPAAARSPAAHKRDQDPHPGMTRAGSAAIPLSARPRSTAFPQATVPYAQPFHRACALAHSEPAANRQAVNSFSTGFPCRAAGRTQTRTSGSKSLRCSSRAKRSVIPAM